MLAKRVRDHRDGGFSYWDGVNGWYLSLGWAALVWITILLIFAYIVQGVGPADALMTRTSFVYQHIHIAQDRQVRFINPKEGNIQMLCVGANKRCLLDENAPDELQAPGLRLLPGQTKTVQFLIPGTYTVLSPGTPGMTLTIAVEDDTPRGP